MKKGIVIGIDPGTRKTGMTIVQWPEINLLHTITISAVVNRPLVDRIDKISRDLAGSLLHWDVHHHIVAVGIECPTDHFGQNRHDTAFKLGRIMQQIVIDVRPWCRHIVEIAPSESSSALGLARNASKSTRILAAQHYFGVSRAYAAQSPDSWDAAAVCVALIGKLKEESYANV